MESTEVETKVAPRSEPKKPEVPRGVQLAAEIEKFRVEYRAKKAELDAEARATSSAAQRKALEKRSVAGKELEGKIAGALKARDKRRVEIERDYKLALQKAQSDRDIAHNELERDFKGTRQAFDKAFAEAVRPTDLEYEALWARTAKDFDAKVKAMQDAYGEKLKPLADELRAIKEAEAAAQKAKTMVLPDEPVQAAAT